MLKKLIIIVFELQNIGIFHSDIKPANIVFKKEFTIDLDLDLVKVEPKIIDFGFSSNNWKKILGRTDKYSNQ